MVSISQVELWLCPSCPHERLSLFLKVACYFGCSLLQGTPQWENLHQRFVNCYTLNTLSGTTWVWTCSLRTRRQHWPQSFHCPTKRWLSFNRIFSNFIQISKDMIYLSSPKNPLCSHLFFLSAHLCWSPPPQLISQQMLERNRCHSPSPPSCPPVSHSPLMLIHSFSSQKMLKLWSSCNLSRHQSASSLSTHMKVSTLTHLLLPFQI